MWVIFAIIKNYKESTQNALKINYLLEQAKNTSLALNSIIPLFTSYSKEQKSYLILQQTDILISDTNEILAEIIKRSNSISSVQMEALMKRTTNGERWLIAKTFIETNNFQSDFSSHLLEKSQKDPLLKGSILEFNIRYQNLHTLLENYDENKILYNTIEYGALGKVFNILSPIANNLSTTKESLAHSQPKAPKAPQTPQTNNINSSSDFPSFLTSSSYAKKAPQPQKKQEPINIEEGLEAIREELTKDTSVSTLKPTPIITSFASTQSALRNLKPEKKTNIISIDELEKEINASPDNNFDEHKTPFGDWFNEKHG